jgi:A/G-specific adenine glycosylase
MKYSLSHHQLFEWWRNNGRLLLWREKEGKLKSVITPLLVESDQVREEAFHHYFASSLRRDPYRVVVAEMMLQQTQVDRVLPKYRAWLEKWPRINDLAQAALSEVLIFWQGLGYNRRARFLWLLAQEIALQRKGQWPNTEEELLKLPGIGKYTARAILSFAFGEHVGVVDTNVKRIFNRVFNIVPPLAEKEYFVLADSLLPEGQADPWNQALMDFGALVCTAKAPKCPDCPLQLSCQVNLQSQRDGFLNYAEFLKQEHTLSPLKKTTKGKDSGLRFEQTDRYFRGRIIDELRNGKTSTALLRQSLAANYGLENEARFQLLITALEKEGLVKIHGEHVEIG